VVVFSLCICLEVSKRESIIPKWVRQSVFSVVLNALDAYRGEQQKSLPSRARAAGQLFRSGREPITSGTADPCRSTIRAPRTASATPIVDRGRDGGRRMDRRVKLEYAPSGVMRRLRSVFSALHRSAGGHRRGVCGAPSARAFNAERASSVISRTRACSHPAWCD
jgi:hypothetical protein